MQSYADQSADSLALLGKLQPADPLELSDAIKRDLIVNWFADHWTQKAANGLLDDYARAILAAAKAKRGAP
jgi:hypothetical protein